MMHIHSTIQRFYSSKAINRRNHLPQRLKVLPTANVWVKNKSKFRGPGRDKESQDDKTFSS